MPSKHKRPTKHESLEQLARSLHDVECVMARRHALVAPLLERAEKEEDEMRLLLHVRSMRRRVEECRCRAAEYRLQATRLAAATNPRIVAEFIANIYVEMAAVEELEATSVFQRTARDKAARTQGRRDFLLRDARLAPRAEGDREPSAAAVTAAADAAVAAADEHRTVFSLQMLRQRVLEFAGLQNPQPWGAVDSRCRCGRLLRVMTLEQMHICPHCNVPIPFSDPCQTDSGCAPTAGDARAAAHKRKLGSREISLRKKIEKAQVKRKKDISRDDVEEIAMELIARGYSDPAALPVDAMYTVLHDLRKNGLYEFGAQLYALLRNRVPEQLSSLLTRKLETFNFLVTLVWDDVRGSRTQFFTYSWLAHSILKLFAATECFTPTERAACSSLLRFFPLPDSKSAREHAILFRRVLESLGLDKDSPGMRVVDRSRWARLNADAPVPATRRKNREASREASGVRVEPLADRLRSLAAAGTAAATATARAEQLELELEQKVVPRWRPAEEEAAWRVTKRKQKKAPQGLGSARPQTRPRL